MFGMLFLGELATSLKFGYILATNYKQNALLVIKEGVFEVPSGVSRGGWRRVISRRSVMGFMRRDSGRVMCIC